MSRRLAPLTLVALLAFPAASAPAAQQYVGKLKGSSAFIAVVKKAERVRAYVCDGTARRTSLSVWFKGRLDGRAFDATSDGVMLDSAIGHRAARGSVLLADDRRFTFRAPRVTRTGGLVENTTRHRGKGYHSGWIVLSDGRVRGQTTLVGGTLFNGTFTSGPSIQPSPKPGTTLTTQQRLELCAQLTEEYKALVAVLRGLRALRSELMEERSKAGLSDAERKLIDGRLDGVLKAIDSHQKRMLQVEAQIKATCG